MPSPANKKQALDSLPSPPAIISKVMKLANDPDCSVADLGAMIARDASLSASVLKSVNSAMYRPRNPIHTAPRAVGFIGVQAVRNLVLCLAARGLFVAPKEFRIETFWEASLRRAASAKMLGRSLNIPNDDELFTLGLFQDIGLLVALVLNPESVNDISELLSLSVEKRLEREEELGMKHEELALELLETWELPASILAPLEKHHFQDRNQELESDDIGLRAKILRTADAIADLAIVEDKLSALSSTDFYLREIGFDPEDLCTLLQQVDTTISESSEMLGIDKGNQPELSEILEDAAEGLANVNLGYEKLVGELETSLDRERALAAKLEELNKKLEEQATTDPLTGILNRRGFDDALDRALAQATRQEKPISLLIADVDFFKKVNDTYGHGAGDAVLQTIARAMEQSVRKADIVARHGGEEFSAILPFTNLEGAAIVAERIRQSIENASTTWENITIKVTASIGCAEVKDPQSARAGVLTLRDADDALYSAKEGGRNCIKTP